SPQPYSFDFMNASGPDVGPLCGPSSTNVFKKNPGVNGLTIRTATGNPKANVRVQFFGPTGTLISTQTTDSDGFCMFNYKHTGKAANYTVKLPDFGLQKTVTLKANGYALAVFDTLP